MRVGGGQMEAVVGKVRWLRSHRAALVGVGVLVVGAVAVALSGRRLAAAKAEAGDAHRSLALKLRRLEQAGRLRRAVDALEGRLLKLKQRFGDPSSITSAVAEVANVARRYNVEVVGLEEPGTCRTGNLFRSMLRLRLRARYRDLADFLHHLTNSTFLMQIKKMKIAYDGEAYPKVSAEMEMEVVLIETEDGG